MNCQKKEKEIINEINFHYINESSVTIEALSGVSLLKKMEICWSKLD